MSRLRPDPRRAERRRQQALQAGTLFLILAGFAAVLALVNRDVQQKAGPPSPPPAPSDSAGAPNPAKAPASSADPTSTAR